MSPCVSRWLVVNMRVSVSVLVAAAAVAELADTDHLCVCCVCVYVQLPADFSRLHLADGLHPQVTHVSSSHSGCSITSDSGSSSLSDIYQVSTAPIGASVTPTWTPSTWCNRGFSWLRMGLMHTRFTSLCDSRPYPHVLYAGMGENALFFPPPVQTISS